jgi:predicted transcriptional regulator
MFLRSMEAKDLTPKETFILSVIYELGEADIHDVLNHVKEEKEWQYTSVETFLTFLYKKGYVNRIKVGRRFRYTPKLTLNEVVTKVLDKLFRGILRKDPSPLINYFIPSVEEMSERERTLLQTLLLSLKKEENESTSVDE